MSRHGLLRNETGSLMDDFPTPPFGGTSRQHVFPREQDVFSPEGTVTRTRKPPAKKMLVVACLNFVPPPVEPQPLAVIVFAAC